MDGLLSSQQKPPDLISEGCGLLGENPMVNFLNLFIN
jgi:hypothetical protein